MNPITMALLSVVLLLGAVGLFCFLIGVDLPGYIAARWNYLIDAIVEAREGPKREPDAELGTPVTLVLPTNDPLVTSRATGGEANPLPLSRTPIFSEKRDAKRAAHAYAERRAGRSLSWGAARQLMKKWERLDREITQGVKG